MKYLSSIVLLIVIIIVLPASFSIAHKTKAVDGIDLALQATPISATEVKLEWRGAEYPDVLGYEILHMLPSQKFESIAFVPALSLSPGQVYHYQHSHLPVSEQEIYKIKIHRINQKPLLSRSAQAKPSTTPTLQKLRVESRDRSVAVAFDLKQPANVRCLFLMPTGEMVGRIGPLQLPAGQQRFTWRPKSSDATSGDKRHYIIELRIDNSTYETEVHLN